MAMTFIMYICHTEWGHIFMHHGYNMNIKSWLDLDLEFKNRKVKFTG